MGFLNRLLGEEPGLIAKIVMSHVEDTGGFGEYLAEYALEHGVIDDGRRAVFRNVLVPRASGPTGTSEVDVLMLHATGIYVIESKNYSGWIFGSEDQQQWVQSLPGGRKKRFYNPIKQNRAHVRALSAHLGLPEEAFRSYIVFSERCELKDVPADAEGYVVCKRPRMMKAIRADVDRRERIIDDARFDELAEELGRLAGASTVQAREEHVEQAKRVKEGEICPFCGGELVHRKGRYGEFLGCSNYPACTFTRRS